MKIVINRCCGGFCVSKAILDKLGIEDRKSGYVYNDDFGIVSYNDEAYRADKRLIDAIESIGLEESGGDLSELKIVEIPDDVNWKIEGYDGCEWVSEFPRTWC